ncbi:MAG: polyprenyl diphosphate synthase [Proteobacteria bacterium]|nr:polyprenyl diphosphate synthase [Pseudomonadota bacterium]MDA0928988.1 polyprenyl diphosphate synthase [Pseudomonadota bacterium]
MTPEQSDIPRHIAIIMDGNSRWARARGLPTKAGHRQGAESAREVVYSCIRRNIPFLTLFAFSSENWMRPAKEVQALMALFLSVLNRSEIRQFHEENVRLKFVGKRSDFSRKLQERMADVEALTANNTGTTVIVAADYGGRWDIAQAARKLAALVEAGELKAADIDETALHQYTSLSEFPDPDLCIRTGGNNRVSNFLLWQFAYTELYFTDCYWPDFDESEFARALDDFAQRQRRFGRHKE